MPVRVQEVCGPSRFFAAGDELISIDSKPVGDQLDILFLTEKEEDAIFTIRRKDGRTLTRRLTTRAFERARLTFEEMRFMSCRCRCIFCFVDQMPPGLRRSLYEKDDDYRLSFLFGNYITLTGVKDKDINRIIALNLSPLYISVHAVSAPIRRRLFGRPVRRDILKSIEKLAREGITMHTQVVLIPGMNDGASLNTTVTELFRFYPACRSVAVVPVGLTKHRRGLEKIRGVTERQARELIRWAKKKKDAFAEKTGGDCFLHLSDEFYLLARRAIPDAASYGDFPQLANGVGMCRRFIEKVKREIERLRGLEKCEMTLVTGTLGGRLFRRYIIPLLKENLRGLELHLLVVRNNLFGAAVGVSGLLSGEDIIAAFRKTGPLTGCLVIPPNALNHEGLLIDDVKPRDLEKILGVRVIVPRTSFLEKRVIKICSGGGGR